MKSNVENKLTNFIEKLTPLVVGLYVFLVFFGVFGVSKVFGEASKLVTAAKGVIFVVFFIYLIFACYIKKINFNRFLVMFLSITFISALISILTAPSSKSILSVGRAWIDIENYYTGWQHKVSVETVTLSVTKRLTAIIDSLLFASCIVIYGIILPKLLDTRKSISKALLYVSMVVALSALCCFVLDRSTIINIIKNPTGQFALKNGVKSIFTNKNTFGLILFAGTIASSISIKIDNSNKARNILMILVQILLFGTTVISLCKTAILLLVIYYFCSLIYKLITTERLTKKLKIISFAVIGALGLVAVIFVFVPSFAAMFGSKISAIQQKIYFLFVNYGAETIGSRTEAWAAVFQTINGESIFFGLGDKIYEEYYVASTNAVKFWGILPYHSTHNSLLNIYLQGGLIRLLSYVALIVYLYRVVIKTMKKDSKTSFYLLLGLVIFTMYSMVEAILFGFHDTIAIIINILCITIPLSFYQSYNLSVENNEQTIEVFNGENIFTILKTKIANVYKRFKSLFKTKSGMNALFSFIFTFLLFIAATFGGYQVYARHTLYGVFYILCTLGLLYLSVHAYRQSDNNRKKTHVLLFVMCSYLVAGIFIRINNLLTPLNIYNGYIAQDSIVELEWKGLYNHYHTGYMPLIFVAIATLLFFLGVTIDFKALFSKKKEDEETLISEKANFNHYEPLRTKDNFKVLVLSHNALANENANAVVLSNMLAHFDDSQIAQIFIKNDTPTRFNHAKFYKITDMMRLKGFFSKNTHGEIVNAEEAKLTNVSKEKNRSKLAAFLSMSALGELIREFIWKHGKFNYEHLYAWIREFNPDVIMFVPSRSVFLNDLTLKIAKDFNLPVMLFTTEDEYFHEKKKINFFHNIMLNKLRKSYHRVNQYVENMVLIQDRLEEMYAKEFHKPCETIMMSSKNHVSARPYDKKLLLYAGNVDRGRISTLLAISKALEKIDTSLKLTVIPGGATEAQLMPLKERKNVEVLEFLPYAEYVKYLESAYVLFNVDTFEKKYNQITKETFTGKTADLLRMGRPLCVVAPKYMYTYEYYIRNPYCAEVCGDLNDLEASLRKVIFNNKYRRMIARNAYLLSVKNHSLDDNAEKFKEALYKAYLKGESQNEEN